MSKLYFLATSILRSSGKWPTCQWPVPAESTNTLSGSTLDLRMPSARGDRQILPRQTINILLISNVLNYLCIVDLPVHLGTSYKLLFLLQGKFLVQILYIFFELFIGGR